MRSSSSSVSSPHLSRIEPRSCFHLPSKIFSFISAFITVICGYLRSGSAIEQYPDQSYESPANQGVDQQGDDGSELEHEVPKGRIDREILEGPEEQVGQLVY